VALPSTRRPGFREGSWRGALGRRALLAAIRFYRRRLRGRGPFARVRCTFEGLETCSEYGLRAALEGPPLRALGRIGRRLRRCRDLSLFALEGGGLGFGAAYDGVLLGSSAARAAAAIDRTLAGDGEGEAVRAAVRNAAARVAAAPFDPAPGAPAGSARLPLVRDARALAGRLAARWRRLAIAALGAAVALAGAAAAGAPPAACALVAFAVALAVLAARATSHRLRRLEWLAVIAALEPAAPAPGVAVGGDEQPVPVEADAMAATTATANARTRKRLRGSSRAASYSP